MNALRNKVQLIGRLGQDPEIKSLESGKKVAHFTLATNENYKSADGTKMEEVTWHNIVAWNGLAELASNYLTKGKEVCIEGRINYRSYNDKNGIQKNVTEIVVSEMLLLSSGGRTKEFSDADSPELSGQNTALVDALTVAGESAVRSGKAKSKVS